MLPLVLGVVVSLSILGFAELGYRRLEYANRAMGAALEMESAVNETLALVSDAETGQRGYLLTGDASYLEPYRAAMPKIDAALSRLRELVVASGTQSMVDRASRLSSLIGGKMNELETTIAMNEKNGREAAMQLVNTGIGKKTMDDIRNEAGAILDELHKSALNGGARWAQDIEFGRVGMLAMTGFTIVLLMVVGTLARREIMSRESKRQSLVEERERLEQEVGTRTAELSELSNYLQTVREEEKSRLARDIHDELGGILVGAKMDVAWVAERFRNREPEVAAKLKRALAMLDEGVEMKRRIIEELRPTLLDNLGLGSAIDWQVHQVCDRAGLQCTLNLGDDVELPPDVTIALYRIVQEALTNIVKYAKARRVEVELVQSSEGVSLLIRDDGVGLPAGADTNALSHGISGMRQRVRALGGEFQIRGKPRAGTTLEVNIPLKGSVTQAAPSAAPTREGRAAAAV
ncbi:MAG TPA: CHASE3 domain-containing protein [Casimicrobiaceae bacterium]